MDFDKWLREKREIENLDSCYLNFEPEKVSWYGARMQENPVERLPQSERTNANTAHRFNRLDFSNKST
jgi:hypothetical protein